MIEHVEEKGAMTRRTSAWRAEGLSVGFVPTMGALHDGHVSLVRAARDRCDRVCVSIFVNPLQFGPNEDLDRYPRDLDRDRDRLDRAGADALFTTDAATMYPRGFSTYVVNDAVATRFEGASRPTHFRGVLTVVAKLFHVVFPDVAFFGQKDAQQATLIRRMVADLEFPLEVDVRPIVRDEDGLALSSRNAFLSPADRSRALSLSRGLRAAEERFRAGERRGPTLVAAAREPLDVDRVDVDYVALVDPATFDAIDQAADGDLLIVAARVGVTRLIDNVILRR